MKKTLRIDFPDGVSIAQAQQYVDAAVSRLQGAEATGAAEDVEALLERAEVLRDKAIEDGRALVHALDDLFEVLHSVVNASKAVYPDRQDEPSRVKARAPVIRAMHIAGGGWGIGPWLDEHITEDMDDFCESAREVVDMETVSREEIDKALTRPDPGEQ